MRHFVLAVAVALSVASAALAEPARPGVGIDLTAPILDEAGQPMRDCVQATADGKGCAKTEIVTVRRALTHALFTMTEQDRQASPDDRWKRGALGLRLEHETAYTPTVDEARVLKDCIGRLYPPLLVARLFSLLDPAAKPAQ